MEGQQSGNVQPLGLLFLIGMAILVWVLPRRRAVIPLLITACYMPLGQMFVVAGLNLHFFRILLLVGCFRILSRRENLGFKVNDFDRIFLWWVAVTVVIGSLTQLSTARFINRSGIALNALGAYFLVRCWTRNLDDVSDTVRFAAWMLVPLAVAMVIEKVTARNMFYLFGGVPELTELRDGKPRCQGAFEHPILAGTYGVTLVPFFAGLWLQGGRDRSRALIGIGSAAVITLTSASSGAFLSLLAVIVGFGLWFFRTQMRLIRWAAVGVLVLLQLVMTADVWWVIARLSDLVGGTGWHRSYLIEQAINHFGEWWLIGSTYTAHWAPYPGQVLIVDPNNMDITNQYIMEGLGGGIGKLGLFITMIVLGFKTVGRLVQRRAGLAGPTRLFIWSIGVSLGAHCVSFLSISYFDQIVVMWYWLLAILSMLSAHCAQIASKRVCQPIAPTPFPNSAQPISRP